MRKIAPNLYVHAEPRGKWTHYSWLLARPQGNFLIACADVGDMLDEVTALGGISRVFITDIHFAAKWHGTVANHFGATLVCHEIDKDKVAARCKARKLETVAESARPGKDFLCLHTPGHADGGLCFYWATGPRRLLFTGDFLCNEQGVWTVFCGKSKRGVMAKSLAAVGDLGASGLCPGIGDSDPGEYVGLGRERVGEVVEETSGRFCG